MNRSSLPRLSGLLLAALTLPAPLAGQEVECLGYDLMDPERAIPLEAPPHTWTLYNLGPGRVTIHASTGDAIPGPAPNSRPEPSVFRGEAGTSYAISLAGPGLSIVYICPGP